MYLLNAETEIAWVLGKTPNTIVLSDLDLILIDPEGNSTYIDSPINIARFVAPTIVAVGSASYLFTPNIEGLWKINLVIGTSLDYKVLSKVDMYVLNNSTEVNPVDIEYSECCACTSTVPSVYCPGYTPVYVDSSTFRVDGLNVINLFSVSRKLTFTVNGETLYGTISASDFGTTSAGNTTVVVDMDDGAVLTAGLTQVCLITSAVSWIPIVTSPFESTSINAIHSGKIGLQVWWVAVGDGGKLFTSEDKGITWVQRATSTTENLNCVGYDYDNERFIVGGNVGVLLKSVNCTDWTLDTTTVLSTLVWASTPGTGNIIAITYSVSTDFMITFHEQTLNWPQHGTAKSIDFGVTWTDILTSYNCGLLTVSPLGSDNDVLFRHSGISSLRRSYGTNYGSYSFPYTSGSEYFQDGSMIKALSVDRCVIVGDEGQVIRSTDANLLIFAAASVPSFGLSNVNGVVGAIALNGLFVAVGDNGKIAYSSNYGDTFIQVSNGFIPTANINDVHYDEEDKIFIAVANNGQICRSTNGIV